MKQKQIDKQRLIGKQLMLVDLIHEENDSNTGFSFVSKDKLSKWSRMEKDEIIKIVNTCAYMDDFNMQCNAAKDLAYHKTGSAGSNAYLFYLSTSYILDVACLYCMIAEYFSTNYVLTAINDTRL